MFKDLNWITLLGVSNAGKTSLVNVLRNITTKTIPTQGLKNKTLRIGNWTVKFYDFGGQEKFLENWLDKEKWGWVFKKNTTQQKINIFVIDPLDDRIDATLNFYKRVCQNYGIPDFIIFTKSDLIGADYQSYLSRYLDQIKNVPHYSTTIKSREDVVSVFQDLLQKKIAEWNK